jgi:hypothetical protein
MVREISARGELSRALLYLLVSVFTWPLIAVSGQMAWLLFMDGDSIAWPLCSLLASITAAVYAHLQVVRHRSALIGLCRLNVRRPRFSLRALLLAVVVAAVACAVGASPLRTAWLTGDWEALAVWRFEPSQNQGPPSHFASSQVDDAMLWELAHSPAAPSLTWLDLKCSRVTDEGLAYLQKFPALSRLSLQGTAIGDAGLVHIGKLQNLVDLDLEETKVTDDGLRHLANLRLRSLSLAGTQVNGSGFRNLGNMWIRDLTLRETLVDDEGVEFIAEMWRIDILELTDTPLTDCGLTHLARMRQLEWLFLPDSITQSGVKELATALPDCDVIGGNSDGEQ